MDPFFTITQEPNTDGDDNFDIDINIDHGSCFFQYVINSSRVHWRDELEYHWGDAPRADIEAYQAKHKFDIAGPRLSAEQIQEQKQNLINKIFSIGYILHRFKSPSRAWSPYAMDNKIGENGECNGRSGKSFLFRAFRFLMNTETLSGRNPKLLENNHVFERVDQYTDFVLVDDCDRHLPMSQFYDITTSGMTINPKNNKSFFLEFEQAPKIGFTTNYVPRDFDASTNARMLYMVFSDYYHEKTAENDYLESRSIRDDFNHNLMASDYREDQWNKDFNFFAQCLQFYLDMTAKNQKIQPPMSNIIKRKYKADMGSSFEDWASNYFAPGGENLNKTLVRTYVIDDFLNSSKVQRSFWTTQRFTKALKAFVKLCPYITEINPLDVRDKSKRLFTKTKEGITAEGLYLRSIPADELEDESPATLFNASDDLKPV